MLGNVHFFLFLLALGRFFFPSSREALVSRSQEGTVLPGPWAGQFLGAESQHRNS